MQKEFGAYFPIELPEKKEFFTSDSSIRAERYDCGRNAIAVAAMSAKASKVYIPYYNCDTVRETLEINNIPYELYYLDDELNPIIPKLSENEWLLWVNYFGNCRKERYEYLEKKYKRIIFDNTQSFFADPIIGEQCFNVYSPRKFFGVSDGAYLVWGNDYKILNDFPVDASWERCAFMLKSIELGTNAAYQDNLCSMEHFGKDIRKMSVLTQRILSSIDYDDVREKRNRNISVVKEGLKDINKFPFEINDDLMAYPLYIENNNLRKLLVENKIYVSQWWKYLLDIVPENSLESRFSKWIFPIPIDQRYSEEDMKQLVGLVRRCCCEA